MQKDKSQLSTIKYAEYIHDFTALGNPFLLLLIATVTLNGLYGQQMAHNFMLLLFTFFVNEIICSGIKYLWHKPRPNGQTFSGAFEKIDAGSFPSIHASRIMLIYGSLSYIAYIKMHYLLIPIFILVILTVGYSRIFLKKHFLTDVLAGYAFGALLFFGLTFLFN